MNAYAGVTLAGLLSFAQAQQAERELLQRVCSGPQTSLFKIWRTQQALVVPRGMPSRARFDAAAAMAGTCGWPVFERDTGGDLTPQMPGVVNISMAFRMDGATPNIRAAYLRLTDPVIAFLSTHLGLKGYLSAIPGAFCDGAYNIAIDNKKLAGTAQRWKILSHSGETKSIAMLGHIALMCDCELAPAIGAINAFYASMGLERRVELACHTTLRQHLGADRSEPAKIACALDAALAQQDL